ncbi:MAG: MFS transporter [Methanomassiliicoccaceae archaeon]|jgi:EmrB/QacA subfamily drug resistance transporter|nr:MFS transporter [Methanomassiliicoccaceae archaeon]
MDADHDFSIKEKRIVLIACCIGAFLAPLSTTMINLAVPTISAEFIVSAHNQGWLVMAYFLSSVAFMIPMSRLSDLYGKRMMFIIGIVIVLVSSLFSALSTSFEILLAWRLITGLGTAGIASTSISMIAQVFPRSSRGLPLALNTMCVYIGASLGPVIGGLLTDLLGWRSMFFSMVPFSIAALLVIFFFKKDFKTSEGEPFDLKGSLLYGIGIVALMYGILTVPEVLSAAFIAAGIVLLIAFFNFETKEKYPVLMVRLFKGRLFRRANISAFLNYGASYAVVFTMSLYLQNIGGMGPGTAGLVILVQPAIQAVITPFAGRMSDKMDPRILTTSGMIMMCLSTALMTTLSAEVEMLRVYAVLVMTGIGYALFSSPNTNLVMSSVTAKNYSESSGVISVMRQVGMMTSVAIIMCMIAFTMGTDTHIPDMVDEFITSIRYAFAVCCLLGIAGTFMTWFSRDRPHAEHGAA